MRSSSPGGGRLAAPLAALESDAGLVKPCHVHNMSCANSTGAARGLATSPLATRARATCHGPACPPNREHAANTCVSIQVLSVLTTVEEASPGAGSQPPGLRTWVPEGLSGGCRAHLASLNLRLRSTHTRAADDGECLRASMVDRCAGLRPTAVSQGQPAVLLVATPCPGQSPGVSVKEFQFTTPVKSTEQHCTCAWHAKPNRVQGPFLHTKGNTA